MKTVMITGSDRNIGLALAHEFLKRGWFVFVGRYLTNYTGLDDLKAEFPDQMEIVMADVSSGESLSAAAAYVAGRTDCLDMIVHNSAVFGDHPANPEEIDFSRF